MPASEKFCGRVFRSLETFRLQARGFGHGKKLPMPQAAAGLSDNAHKEASPTAFYEYLGKRSILP
ncbi:hypothetical protein [aff. Roholtiella sp. LEGE 12411]|uniref:hypothetical protein n=1 Tax=aff. Roholtiella sp. LEGE 12411 TaxID=1828822 RepID=UPI00187EFB81|nr:hypothetical protein [aff. Roholtiella sp. LEGE 12411]MBE9034134.1 hypothetical protein [aff. Roholtiella sp. LEGE 12411]